ncbi:MULTISPECIES: hypothetical protein [unclassified Dyadobacter]|uniref:Uncharacterized protein n=2 Tax=Dyadobacter helix TaxID=2822344 RepID=A0A916JBQ0_9BACT|nr:hypothetical protein [Dyadobacter sp. 50-39]CAG5001313.1 hypothetical protein DYBT9275_02640 [Dyadobacter sp. CECT 9275]
MISVANLFIVACLGLLMRLKILLPFPWVEQRFVLHAHSHFAFSGWLTQVLMLAIAAVISSAKPGENLPTKYSSLLAFNLVCSYGMLVSFLFQGYGAVSIAFSSLSILVGIVFLYFFQTDTSNQFRDAPWRKWFLAALFFNVLSSLGTFSLAYVMASKMGNAPLKLASIYFFLHFQYNGWFSFASLGLLQQWLHRKRIIQVRNDVFLYLFTICCVLTYFLSINEMLRPLGLQILTILASVIQLATWCWLLRTIWRNTSQITSGQPNVIKLMLLLAAIAATIKFGLQAASSVPVLAHFAFGVRPIIIAYLHLVLLAMITLFVLAWLSMTQILPQNKLAAAGLYIFVAGIFLNESFLLFQGFNTVFQIAFAGASVLLAGAALLMACGIGIALWGYLRREPSFPACDH